MKHKFVEVTTSYVGIRWTYLFSVYSLDYQASLYVEDEYALSYLLIHNYLSDH